MSVERNYEFFKSKLSELLPQHKGQFVLIREEQVVGFYPTSEEALKDAYQRFTDSDFIIQEITDENRVNYIHSAFLRN